MKNEFVLCNGHIVSPSAIAKGDIYIRDGIITDIGKDLRPGGNTELIDIQDEYILPGFRDQHMHHMYGQLEADKSDIDTIAARAGEVAKAKAKEGVTKFWLALFGGPVPQMEAYLRGIKKYIDSPDNGKEGAKLLGSFIEGTFINTECRGAQAPEYVFRPDEFTGSDAENSGKSPLQYCKHVIDLLYDTGAFSLVNIVPDYGEPSRQLIEYAAGKGLTVGMGHTNCHAEDIRLAMARGLSFFVHFTNGPTGHNTKPFGGGGAYEGGVTLPILKEFILDGFHVDYRVALDIMKGSIEVHGQSLDNFILVTDQLLPIKEEVPKDVFTIGTTHARASCEKGFIEVVGYEKDGKVIPPPPNTLCASLSTMNGNFSNYLSIRTKTIDGIHSRHQGVSLLKAVVEGAKLCATNQARFIGTAGTGSIEIGQKADIVTGMINGHDGDYNFSPGRVYVEGIEVYKA